MNVVDLINELKRAPTGTRIEIQGQDNTKTGEIDVVRPLCSEDIIKEGGRWILRSKRNVW